MKDAKCIFEDNNPLDAVHLLFILFSSNKSYHKYNTALLARTIQYHKSFIPI